MAEYNGSDWRETAMNARLNTLPALGLLASGIVWMLYELGYPPPPLVTYKMRGMDALVDSLYDAWLSVGEPDSSGSKYSGTLTRPLRDIIVIDSWIMNV